MHQQINDGTAPRRRTALDLFAGTGSATAALRTRGWRVVGVDLAPTEGADVVADVLEWPFSADLDVDFLWMSPPCTEFSNARPGSHLIRPSLELVFRCLDLVADLRPRFWCLENVVGAIPYLGIPAQKVGPFCLWGYFPTVHVTYRAHTHRKMAQGRSAVDRSRLPASFSVELANALDRWWGVPSLLDLRPFRRHRRRPRERAAQFTFPGLKGDA